MRSIATNLCMILARISYARYTCIYVYISYERYWSRATKATAISCPRDQRFSASWVPNWQPHFNPSNLTTQYANEEFEECRELGSRHTERRQSPKCATHRSIFFILAHKDVRSPCIDFRLNIFYIYIWYACIYIYI